MCFDVISLNNDSKWWVNHLHPQHQWILPVVKSKSYRQKYTSKDLNMATHKKVIVSSFLEGSMRSAVMYRPLCKSMHCVCCEYLIHIHLQVCYSNTILGWKVIDNIQYIQVSELKHIEKGQSSISLLVSLTKSFHISSVKSCQLFIASGSSGSRTLMLACLWAAAQPVRVCDLPGPKLPEGLLKLWGVVGWHVERPHGSSSLLKLLLNLWEIRHFQTSRLTTKWLIKGKD